MQGRWSKNISLFRYKGTIFFINTMIPYAKLKTQEGVSLQNL